MMVGVTVYVTQSADVLGCKAASYKSRRVCHRRLLHPRMLQNSSMDADENDMQGLATSLEALDLKSNDSEELASNRHRSLQSASLFRQAVRTEGEGVERTIPVAEGSTDANISTRATVARVRDGIWVWMTRFDYQPPRSLFCKLEAADTSLSFYNGETDCGAPVAYSILWEETYVYLSPTSNFTVKGNEGDIHRSTIVVSADRRGEQLCILTARDADSHTTLHTALRAVLAAIRGTDSNG